ncbi:hypothetical protein ACFQY5_15650 [Paeniroseomonas aquatica]|uniref:hypothetical protein n=1 Tax=Paeniroseomonas aquatica TaxID=373043 RepID=UPI003608456C
MLDPAAAATASLAPGAARAAMAEAMERPGAAHHPDCLCFTEAATLELLGRFGVLAMILWWGERLLREVAVVALQIVPAARPVLALERPGSAGGRVAEAPLLLVRGRLLWEAAGDPSPRWIESLQTAAPQPATALLRLHLPLGGPVAGPVGASPVALRLLLLEVGALARIRAGRSPIPAGWKQEYRPPRHRAAADAAALLGIGPILPRLPVPGRRDIGFVVPLFSFAGLEKVLLNQAAVLRGHGWRTHLIVLGSAAIDRGEEFPASFDTVMLIEGLGRRRSPGRAATSAPAIPNSARARRRATCSGCWRRWTWWSTCIPWRPRR